MAGFDFVRRVIDRILLIEDEPPTGEEIQDSYDSGEEEYDPSEPAYSRASEDEGRMYVLRQDRSEFAGMPVILSRPKNMDDARAVGERVRERVPVIMNLESTDDQMSQRIVDFVGGVVFALQGSISRAGKAVYICSPADIPVEDLRTEPERGRTSLFELSEEPERARMAL